MTDSYVMIGRNQISTSSVAAFYVAYQLFTNRLRSILCKDNQNIFCNEYYNFRDVTYELEPGKIRIHLPRNLIIEFYKGIYPSVVEEYDFKRTTSWCTAVVPFMRDAKLII